MARSHKILDRVVLGGRRADAVCATEQSLAEQCAGNSIPTFVAAHQRWLGSIARSDFRCRQHPTATAVGRRPRSAEDDPLLTLGEAGSGHRNRWKLPLRSRHQAGNADALGTRAYAGMSTKPEAAVPGHSSYRTSGFSVPPFFGPEGKPTALAAAMLSSPIFPRGPLSATTQSTDLPLHVTLALQPRTTPAVCWTISGGTTMYGIVSAST